MVTVKLFGGLGNQMFQYALGRSLALKNKVPLQLDVSHYDQYPDRVFELDCFKLINDAAIGGPPKNYYDFSAADTVAFTIKQFLKMLYGSPQRVTQHGFSYDLIGLIGNDNSVGKFDQSILNAGGNSYLVGFWQNQKYFLNYAEPIKNDFEFKEGPTGQNSKLLKKISAEQAVSLHVRRGDYIGSAAAKTIGTLPQDYYKRAVGVMKSRVKKPVFYIFSDDPQWCKQNLKLGKNAVVVDHNPPNKGYEDMRLMAACKHNVIANSSFSWWAAWLNSNPKKIVIAPKVWFRDTTIDTSDVVPEQWIRV